MTTNVNQNETSSAQWESVDAGGSWRKPWDNPGDTLEAVFIGLSKSPSKFGGEQTVLHWKEKDSDAEFNTNAPAMLARLAQQFKTGVTYRIIFKGSEKTPRGNTIKTFQAFAARQDVPF
jgi:hypothetical protein